MRSPRGLEPAAVGPESKKVGILVDVARCCGGVADSKRFPNGSQTRSLIQKLGLISHLILINRLKHVPI